MRMVEWLKREHSVSNSLSDGCTPHNVILHPKTHRQLVPHRRRPHLLPTNHTGDGFSPALQLSERLENGEHSVGDGWRWIKKKGGGETQSDILCRGTFWRAARSGLPGLNSRMGSLVTWMAAWCRHLRLGREGWGNPTHASNKRWFYPPKVGFWPQ